MAAIPGGPKGRVYKPGFLDSKVVEFGVYPGQSVTIQRGLPANISAPDRVTVVGEYPATVVFRLEFDQNDEDGHKVVAWNHTIGKQALVSGEAIVKDAAGRDIKPKQDAPAERRRRNDDYEGPRYDCTKGQEVRIISGLPGKNPPTRVTVKYQNPGRVVFTLEYETAEGRVRKVDYAISKRELDEGKASFADMDGNIIGPAKARRRDDGRGGRGGRGYGGYGGEGWDDSLI